MTKYKVVATFEDVPHQHLYAIGDTYPKDGLKSNAKRLKLLSSTANKYETVFIEKVTEEVI